MTYEINESILEEAKPIIEALDAVITGMLERNEIADSAPLIVALATLLAKAGDEECTQDILAHAHQMMGRARAFESAMKANKDLLN